MPVAEQNEAPRGQPYGAATEQQEFVAASEAAIPPPAEEAATPLEGLVFQPPPPPNVRAAPTDMVVQGAPVDTDAMGALMQPGVGFDDMDALEDWLPLARILAERDDAPPILKDIVRLAEERAR